MIVTKRRIHMLARSVSVRHSLQYFVASKLTRLATTGRGGRGGTCGIPNRTSYTRAEAPYQRNTRHTRYQSFDGIGIILKGTFSAWLAGWFTCTQFWRKRQGQERGYTHFTRPARFAVVTYFTHWGRHGHGRTLGRCETSYVAQGAEVEDVYFGEQGC